MNTSLYLYQNNHPFSHLPQPPYRQHHVVIADADTGQSYIVHSCTTDPHHYPVSEHIVGTIRNKKSAIYFEFGSIGRRTTNDIAADIAKQNLKIAQVKKLQAAYRALYREELVLPNRPPLSRVVQIFSLRPAAKA